MNRARWWADGAKWFAAALSAAAGVAAVYFVFSGPITDRPPAMSAATPAPSPPRPGFNDARLTETVREVQELQRTVDALAETPARSRLGAQLSRTRRTVRRLSSEMSALEDALGNDPVKALQVALLQRELRSSSATSKATIDSLRQDIERQYDLMKFVVGTLALGMLGIVVSVVIPALRERREGNAAPSQA